ncbi:MAG: DEAD/DEAH box helicase [archaeon]
MKDFKELGLTDEILKVVAELNFDKPSEIQEKSIPLVLQGKDIIAGSATGSGKTLIFASGIIQNLKPAKKVQALIITPTRELSEQITQALRIFSKYKPMNIISIYGGVSIIPQIKQVKTADIVIGTPGRILDHLRRETLLLDNLKILVLDEADRMLDMGFIDDMKEIIKACPKKRQTLLFSATIDQDVVHISQKYMSNPVEVSAESYVSAEHLEQIYYDVPSHLKFALFVQLLKEEKSDLVMVFCNTRHNTDFVAKNLRFQKIQSLAIHGGFSQNKRSYTLSEFHKKNIQVLVCTDVAARGLDIKGISHIYNYDMPKTSEEYIHRIGRTARAGKNGKVINIVSSRDYDNLSNVLKDESIKIIEQKLPRIQEVAFRRFDRPYSSNRRFSSQGKRQYSSNFQKKRR